MRAPAYALLAGIVAAALSAALSLRHDDTPAVVENAAPRLDAPAAPAPEHGAIDSAPAASAPAHGAIDSAPAVGAPGIAPPNVPVTGEVELFERMDEESYAQAGEVFVDHLVTRGLARSDAERIVRAANREITACLRDALRLEAEAQAVDYDAVLNAIEAMLEDADGPFLWSVIDMTAVQARAEPCVLTVTQRAGISPSFFQEFARPARR